ncbi:S41 family peptidase [Tamlana sp. 2201CG12-4]|uniref:S41 family peptidase n=1 Tax=Tamlana sp. 2201CG12-4 TaxID=3112582 RepID=UPI002DBD9148|nr:S41 family peptidase [Tamlana sp. 2201CG12-4]MEC3907738.1 S41 family peptidase [Tamlana sp. 2201CG12-4]
MKRLILSIALLLLLASCKSVEKHNKQITTLHTVEDLHKDVDKLYKQLKRHHPRLYQYTSKIDLDFKFDSLKNEIRTPMTSRDFYKMLSPVLVNVRQGHVSVKPPEKQFKRKERKELQEKKFEFYDLDFEFLEHKLWVKANRGKDSTLVGNEVISIDGEPALNLINSYKTRFASDGYNTTMYNRAVGKGFPVFYYRDKGFLDSLKVTFKSKDSIFTKIFRRVEKEEKQDEPDSTSIKKVKPKKLAGAEKKASRLSKRKTRKEHKKYGYLAKRKQYTRNFKFIGEDSTVAYMKIRSFTNGNYKKFYQESFKKLDAAKTKHFILDLRDNGGGRIAEIDYLYAYLTTKDYQFITESEINSRVPFLKYLMSNTSPNSLKVLSGLLSPIIVTHNLLKTKKKDDKLYYNFKRHSKLKAPNPVNYKDKLYVLINGNSFSASSLLSTHLKATKRAVFVGEETGGAFNGTVAGIYKYYELPVSKLKVRMGLMQIEAPQKQHPDGYGIKPDIQITPTVKDRNAGIDTELEWVLQDIYKTE